MTSVRRELGRSALLVAGMLLSACAALPRVDAVPASMTEQATVPGFPTARLWLDRDLTPLLQGILRNRERELAALSAAGQPTDPLPPASLLAISGGGDAGAFGAGVLAGWTARGDRPVFKVVTGVSVGALIAPFAFLGPDYDDVSRTVATTAGPDDILEKRSTIEGLINDGLASSAPLARLVARYVTPDVLRAVAGEYAKGRLLLVSTTDLDAGRQSVWNMGEIASSAQPGALELFRKILVASASIPGVVSPVMIDVESQGRHYQEMHVDGGIVAQVFLTPAAILMRLQEATGQRRDTRVYVIRNGRLEPDWSETTRRTLAITRRSISIMVEAQGVRDVNRLYRTAVEDGADFNVAYVGADFDCPHPEEFDSAFMKKLYDYGYSQALAGVEWRKTPPMPRRPSVQELTASRSPDN